MSRPDETDIWMAVGILVIIAAFAWGFIIGRFA